MREDYFYTEGLTVGYQGVPLIREIAFQLKKGEILTPVSYTHLDVYKRQS